jgi:hypothetical protein
MKIEDNVATMTKRNLSCAAWVGLALSVFRESPATPVCHYFRSRSRQGFSSSDDDHRIALQVTVLNGLQSFGVAQGK